jgi:hypothetical protein
MARFASAALLLVLVVTPAFALLKVAPPPGVATRAAADLVVVGKVTAVEKEEVEVAQYPGSPQKVSYKVAVVKVEDTLAGKTNETHIKIGFQPVGGRRGVTTFDFKENAEGVFFLRKHHDGAFYSFDYNTQPLDATAKSYKADLETVKKAVAVFADPMKALKAKEKKDAYFAAGVLVAKYRTPLTGTTVRTENLPTDESKLILQTILEADWTAADRDVPPPYQTFVKLGMTQKDGWKPAPFAGNGDFNAHMKDEFKKWMEGDGAKFQIKKYVAAK